MWRQSFRVARCEDVLDEDHNPFTTNRYRHLRYGAAALPEAEQPASQIDVSRLMDGCLFRSALGGFGGGVMGLLMGGFFHTMQPVNVDTTLSSWEQIKMSYRGFGQACTRMARNFSKVGVVYAGVECWLERERAARDLPNAMYAGCITGGILAFQAGPQAMAWGCGGFAVFSAIIEVAMGH
eukprot:TRINITY_DN100932_c0_g1_i1.p2 TRINITY_DN100932_c0_g1~~TRINITY_DN100932_c0_g1_i1.p2  ORF type:complete len:181 (-),score=35.93 TRINITY_DN100932_c0_g1_i1:143-685(-)